MHFNQGLSRIIYITSNSYAAKLQVGLLRPVVTGKLIIPRINPTKLNTGDPTKFC